MGMLKRRVQPEDVIINCSKDSKIPKPPEGHKWKEVRHDKNVSVQRILCLFLMFSGFECQNMHIYTRYVENVPKICL